MSGRGDWRRRRSRPQPSREDDSPEQLPYSYEYPDPDDIQPLRHAVEGGGFGEEGSSTMDLTWPSHSPPLHPHPQHHGLLNGQGDAPASFPFSTLDKLRALEAEKERLEAELVREREAALLNCSLYSLSNAAVASASTAAAAAPTFPVAFAAQSSAEAELLRVQEAALLAESSSQPRFGGQANLLSLYIAAELRRDSPLALAPGEEEFAFSCIFRNRDKAGLSRRSDVRDQLPDYDSGVIRRCPEAEIPAELFAIRHAIRRCRRSGVQNCRVEMWLWDREAAEAFAAGPGWARRRSGAEDPLEEAARIAAQLNLQLLAAHISAGGHADSLRMDKARERLRRALRPVPRDSPPRFKPRPRAELRREPSPSHKRRHSSPPSSSKPRLKSRRETSSRLPVKERLGKRPSPPSTSTKKEAETKEEKEMKSEPLRIFLAAVLEEAKEMPSEEDVGEVLWLGESDGEEEAGVGIAATFSEESLESFACRRRRAAALPDQLPPEVLALAESLDALSSLASNARSLKVFTRCEALVEFWSGPMKAGAASKAEGQFEPSSHPANRLRRTLAEQRWDLEISLACSEEEEKLLAQALQIAQAQIGLHSDNDS